MLDCDYWFLELVLEKMLIKKFKLSVFFFTQNSVRNNYILSKIVLININKKNMPVHVTTSAIIVLKKCVQHFLTP